MGRDDRTPEQKAADDGLTAAVEEAARAYGYVEPGGITVQYMVLLEQRIWRDDGTENTGVVTIYKDGTMPWVSILGLLRAVTLRSEREYSADREEE